MKGAILGDILNDRLDSIFLLFRSWRPDLSFNLYGATLWCDEETEGGMDLTACVR